MQAAEQFRAPERAPAAAGEKAAASVQPPAEESDGEDDEEVKKFPVFLSSAFPIFPFSTFISCFSSINVLFLYVSFYFIPFPVFISYVFACFVS